MASTSDSFPHAWDLISSEQIASLWSGYGTITRRTYVDPLTLRQKTTIVKRVSAPQTKAYNESNVRKLLSYEIERYFYTHLTEKLEGSNANLALLYRHDAESLEMEDLSVRFPVEARGALDRSQTRVVLDALATFHATYWVSTDEDTSVFVPPPSPSSLSFDNGEVRAPVQGIWEEGSYWYLRTRMTEYDSLNDEWQRTAKSVDAKLGAIAPRFRTILHGDLKSANIFFSADGRQCAFYDLQYVGLGPGVRDLAKFFVSSVRGLGQYESEFLRLYWDALQAELKGRGKVRAAQEYTWEVMIEHYELCFVDYWRFMLGWGSWGDVAFAESKVNSILMKWRKTEAHRT